MLNELPVRALRQNNAKSYSDFVETTYGLKHIPYLCGGWHLSLASVLSFLLKTFGSRRRGRVVPGLGITSRLLLTTLTISALDVRSSYVSFYSLLISRISCASSASYYRRSRVSRSLTRRASLNSTASVVVSRPLSFVCLRRVYGSLSAIVRSVFRRLQTTNGVREIRTVKGRSLVVYRTPR